MPSCHLRVIEMYQPGKVPCFLINKLFLGIFMGVFVKFRVLICEIQWLRFIFFHISETFLICVKVKMC